MREQELPPNSLWYNLWLHMSEQHDLILVESEIHEIVQIVRDTLITEFPEDSETKWIKEQGEF